MKRPKRILVIRNSAIGDVAIAATLLRPYASANPDVEFIMVSNGFLKPLFDFGTGNVRFVAADFKGRHKGFPGLVRLSSELRRMKPDVIADLHNVIRSKVVRLLMPMTPERHMDKQRKAKNRLIQGETVKITPTIRKYEEILLSCGLEDLGIGLPSDSYLEVRPLRADRTRRIGIAPFSKHRGKEWPIENIDRVLAHFEKRTDYRFYLFGGGDKERQQLEALAGKYGNVESLAGKQGLGRELEIIRDLDLMVCTDSANLHFASYCGTAALSIWGATHPKAGFYGWRQHPGNAVQLGMDCRPCSIYGNSPCSKGDYPCMKGIAPETVIRKIESLLESRTFPEQGKNR